MRLRRPVSRCTAAPRYRVASGFTLLEVLVSILILSFGVLGAAGMQIAALQANKEARYQSTAVRLGSQLADLMQANAAISKSSASSNIFLLDNVNGTLATYTQDCVTNSCSATDQAKSQIQNWTNQLINGPSGLPGAKIVVCFDDTPFDASNKPQWACSGVKSATTRTYIKMGWTSSTIDSTSTTSSAAILDKATVPKLILDVIPG